VRLRTLLAQTLKKTKKHERKGRKGSQRNAKEKTGK
jgi:hypothetical protein